MNNYSMATWEEDMNTSSLDMEEQIYNADLREQRAINKLLIEKKKAWDDAENGRDEKYDC